MANGQTKNIPLITDEDISALQGILNDMKAGARDAHQKGNLTTFRIYEKLARIVSPEVIKAQARKERQDLARMNKDAETMKGTPSGTP